MKFSRCPDLFFDTAWPASGGRQGIMLLTASGLFLSPVRVLRFLPWSVAIVLGACAAVLAAGKRTLGGGIAALALLYVFFLVRGRADHAIAFWVMLLLFWEAGAMFFAEKERLLCRCFGVLLLGTGGALWLSGFRSVYWSQRGWYALALSGTFLLSVGGSLVTRKGNG